MQKIPKIAKVLKRKAFGALDKLFLIMIKIIPPRLRVYLKSNIEVVKRIDFDEKPILLNIESDIEYTIRLHSCGKDPEMKEWFTTFFKEGDVFYDVGANVGGYSLVAAKLFNHNLKIYAFEPSYLNFSQLNKNICLNKAQDSITPLFIALSDETGMGNFNYSNLISGGALHAYGRAVDFKGEAFNPRLKLSVVSFRLDDLIDILHIPVANHIKIDVDGLEYEILKGAVKTLKNPVLKSILLEANEKDERTEKITELLSQNGFILFARRGRFVDKEVDPTYIIYNYIFHKK